VSPEVRFTLARGSDQLVVPLAVTRLWLLALNEVPFHHLPVVVFSTATDTPITVVPDPEFDEAEPVIVPVQLAP
jgi:hypothetical protein